MTPIQIEGSSAMNIQAISGSLRKSSTNHLLLTALQQQASASVSIHLFQGLGSLPIFNPDLEGALTPDSVLQFCKQVEDADALIVSCPEYVRAIPGGLKNAIDWLVSRDEIIAKPVALVHASARGDDMLCSLRMVLATVTDRFATDIFLRMPISSNSLSDAERELSRQENTTRMGEFLRRFEMFVSSGDCVEED